MDQIRPLCPDIQANWPQLGKLLVELNNICRQPRQFGFVLRRLHLKPSTVNYLIQLTRRFDGLGVDPPADVSWRHLVEVKDVLNTIDLPWILTICRTFQREEISAMVRDGFFHDY